MARVTIEKMVGRVGIFRDWIKRKKKGDVRRLNYSGTLEFISYLDKRGLCTDTKNHYMVALRHYYNHLNVKRNIFQGLTIKGVRTRQMVNLLSREELQDIYESIEPNTPREMLSKVTCGLFCFQGIRAQEIENLELLDIDTRQGAINLKGGRRINGRRLRLEPMQLIDLVKYTEEVRPILLQKYKRQTDVLLITSEAQQAFDKLRRQLTEQLQKNNHKYTDLIQLRRSVIVNWLKEDNLRIAQYKAGHRYVSSTERYQTNNLEELKEIILFSHPMG